MTDFLAAQMDYIFFLYGLSFVLLAAVVHPLSHRPGTAARPWAWLAAFGLLHGGNEWLDLLALSVGDHPAFAGLRLAVMAASFLCLLEFGRGGTSALGGRAPGRWIALPLLALALAGALAGMAGLNAGVRYALGLTGGLWSAWVRWRCTRSPPAPSCRRRRFSRPPHSITSPF